MVVHAAPPAASAGSRPAPAAVDAFGIDDGALWPDGIRLYPVAEHVAAIGRSGFTSVRALAPWNAIEPQPPDTRGRRTLDWRRTDTMATLLARSGLRWSVLLGFTTGWGTTVPGTVAGSPRAGPFAAYAASVAERYGDGGTFWRLHPELPYAPAVTFQVWNEPNVGAGLTAMAPDVYANLYLATRKAILAVQPHARVTVGALAHSAPRGEGGAVTYLQQMFRARPDLAGQIDAVGLTIYRRTPEQAVGQLAGVRAELDALGERTTPIDIDEVGWATRGTILLTDVGSVTEALRAAFFPELVERLVASDCGVRFVSPYAWITEEDDPFSASAWFGVADPATAELRPAGRALAAAVSAAASLPRLDPAPVCGRPDLPRFMDDRPPVPAAFAVRLVRDCRARRLTVRWTLGEAPEPARRLRVRLPGRRVRQVDDPDGGGPRTAPTALRARLPARTGTVMVTALDGLERTQATASARLRACPR